MSDNLVDTPYGNTGCVDTRENALRGLIDWVSVTFRACRKWEEVARIIGLDFSFFEVVEIGYQGYKRKAIYKDIFIAFEPSENTKNMGVHLNMTGQACRQYEQLFPNNINVWSDLFLLINQYNHKFSRLDIAIDDFKTYFTVNQAYLTAKRGCMTAKRVKKARTFEEFFIETGETDSRTFYVGKCDWMIRFYNKKVERENKGYILADDIKKWNRYEIQLRNNIATEAAKVIAFTSIDLGVFVRGFLADKIDFKVKNKNDTNKSRWKSTRWWESFLNDVEKIPLTQLAPDPTIPKIHNWLDNQVNTSFMAYLEAFDYNPIVYEYFKVRGLEKLEDDRNKNRIIQEFEQDKELKELMLADMAEYLETKKDNRDL